MGNGIETECLLLSAKNCISPTRQPKTFKANYFSLSINYSLFLPFSFCASCINVQPEETINVLPFGDLATIPFIVAFIVAAARGNIIHSVLAGIVVISMSLLMSSAMAEFQTSMGIIANFTMPEGSALISSIDQAGNLINFIIFKVFAIFN